MKLFGWELILRHEPVELPSVAVEVREEDIAFDLLHGTIIPQQKHYNANFFGLRAVTAHSPFVEEPVLLLPTESKALERYARERFGGPVAQVWREVTLPLRKPRPNIVGTMIPEQDRDVAVNLSMSAVADADEL